MWEFVSSKVVVTATVLILISVAVGFFLNQRETNYTYTEMNNVVNVIGNGVNDMISIQADANMTFTYDTKAPFGTHLPGLINGKAYKLEFTKDQVVLRRENAAVSFKFAAKIHLWKWTILTPEPTKSDIYIQDTNHPSLTLDSGKDFIVETKRLLVDGEYQYHTFLYAK
ncbi:MAG: hypothetical protein QW620_07675 [Thermoplasmata archaeon]